MKKSLLDNIMNVMRSSEDIESTWQEIDIISLPKGNKNPHKMSNKRSISLTDTVCKVFERLILNRIAHKIPFTEAQAGARKGRSTTDQVFILKSAIRSRTARKQPTYIAFLDLHKAYDKVWRSAILENLWIAGIRGKSWRIMKSLNENIKVKIATRYGHTREVNMTEGIRQGGVLSGAEFAFLIDRLECHLQEAGLGIIHGHDLITTLLLMDDIILMADSPAQLQSMLNETNKFANTWHLTFSPEKSKVMGINDKYLGPHQWRLGKLMLQQSWEYRYLGEQIAQSQKLT